MKTYKQSRSRPTTDRTPATGDSNDVGWSLGRNDWTSSPARELAQRLNGSDEVLLLWYPESDRVELRVRDLATDVSFHLEVAPSDAIDAFHHPYAYMFKRRNTGPQVGAGAAARE